MLSQHRVRVQWINKYSFCIITLFYSTNQYMFDVSVNIETAVEASFYSSGPAKLCVDFRFCYWGTCLLYSLLFQAHRGAFCTSPVAREISRWSARFEEATKPGGKGRNFRRDQYTKYGCVPEAWLSCLPPVESHHGGDLVSLFGRR